MSATVQLQEWWFQPLYGFGGKHHQIGGTPKTVLATTLLGAFEVARLHWPSAQGWHCAGSADKAPDRFKDTVCKRGRCRCRAYAWLGGLT